MPAGCGLAIPRLDGVSREQQLWQGEDAAACLAHSFLEAGVSDADDWSVENDSPFQFLKRALERWLSEHHATVIREQFLLDVLLSTSLDRYFASDVKAGVSRVFLTLEPNSARIRDPRSDSSFARGRSSETRRDLSVPLPWSAQPMGSCVRPSGRIGPGREASRVV